MYPWQRWQGIHGLLSTGVKKVKGTHLVKGTYLVKETHIVKEIQLGGEYA